MISAAERKSKGEIRIGLFSPERADELRYSRRECVEDEQVISNQKGGDKVVQQRRSHQFDESGVITPTLSALDDDSLPAHAVSTLTLSPTTTTDNTESVVSILKNRFKPRVIDKLFQKREYCPSVKRAAAICPRDDNACGVGKVTEIDKQATSSSPLATAFVSPIISADRRPTLKRSWLDAGYSNATNFGRCEERTKKLPKLPNSSNEPPRDIIIIENETTDQQEPRQSFKRQFVEFNEHDNRSSPPPFPIVKKTKLDSDSTKSCLSVQYRATPIDIDEIEKLDSFDDSGFTGDNEKSIVSNVINNNKRFSNRLKLSIYQKLTSKSNCEEAVGQTEAVDDQKDYSDKLSAFHQKCAQKWFLNPSPTKSTLKSILKKSPVTKPVSAASGSRSILPFNIQEYSRKFQESAGNSNFDRLSSTVENGFSVATTTLSISAQSSNPTTTTTAAPSQANSNFAFSEAFKLPTSGFSFTPSGSTDLSLAFPTFNVFNSGLGISSAATKSSSSYSRRKRR